MATTHRNIKNVPQYIVGSGALNALPDLLQSRRSTLTSVSRANAPVFLIDEFFAGDSRSLWLSALCEPSDGLWFISTVDEPTTEGVDDLLKELRAAGHHSPCAIVGMGGGITLDTAKAVANLYTNPGSAADYQGWDLVKRPGVYKIGIPTISGTGAESSRTCVLTNRRTGLKMGMNSDHTLFDQLVLDPELPRTVDRNQYFFTGMDAYIHCVESLAGFHRNAVGDALSHQALALCRQVFLEGEMMSSNNRERLMTASYLGGCAIATGYVGVVHPMSAALSVVLGIHHCLANCITMLQMDDFYPEACREFRRMIETQGVEIPHGVCANLRDDDLERMCAAVLLHEKPLANALGLAFREVLTPSRMTDLFRRM